MTEGCYVGYLPTHFKRSCAKDLPSSTLALRNDVAEFFQRLAERVNCSTSNDSGLARDLHDSDSLANDEVLADKDSVLDDLKEKLVAVEATLDELDARETFSDIEGTDLKVRFWDSVLTMECTLQLLSFHFTRLHHSPHDRYESTSSTPLSCAYLARISNVCSSYVDRMNGISLKDSKRVEEGLFPNLLPSDEIVFPSKAEQEWKRAFEGTRPDTISVRKLMVYAMRIKRIQIRMDSILMHISQITRSTFCGVRYGTGDAMVDISVCSEFRNASMTQKVQQWLEIEGVKQPAGEIEDPSLRARVELFDDFRSINNDLRNEVLFYDALGYSCTSPLVFDNQFLGGHRIKLSKIICTKGGVSLADCDRCSSPTEYSEYDRAVGLVTSINLQGEDSSDEEMRTFICDCTARCLHILDTIVKSLATEPSVAANSRKGGADVCKLAFAYMKLRESIEAGVCAWQVCNRSVYPKVTIADIVTHLEIYAGGGEANMTTGLLKYGYLYSDEQLQTFLEWIREVSSSMRSMDDELGSLVTLAVNKSIQSVHGDDFSSAKLKLTYLAITHTCNLSEGCNLLDSKQCERKADGIFKPSFFSSIMTEWCTGRGALKDAVRAPIPFSSRRFMGKESRREVALLNILEMAKAVIPFSSDLSVQAYECYARLQHLRHGTTRGLSGACWSHYERIAVLASRVHRPERAIWHCEVLLDGNIPCREDVNFNQVYRVLKILISQYCVVSEFDKARDVTQRYLNMVGAKSAQSSTRVDVEACIKLKNIFNDLTVSLARVNILDGCPDTGAEIIQDFLHIKDLHNELGEGDLVVEICESAIALLARAYLDMDDVVRATRIIMVMKHVRTERKAARALLRKQLLARGGKLPFKAEYQRVKKKNSRAEGTISTLSSGSDDRDSTVSESFEVHINADSGAADEFYLSSFSDLMLTHIPSYCVPDLNVDMGALQAVTLMKSKAYESALHSLVPTIIGVEQTVQKSNFPVEGVLELANLYLLRGQIAFEASTRCVNVEFPFKIEAMNTYGIIRQLMTEGDNPKVAEAPPVSDFGYGHQDSHYASPSDLLRDAIKWFERSHRMFMKAKATSCVALSAHWIAQCHLEALFVPCAILGTGISKASDISPPLMKSVDNLHVVHKLDVKNDVDIGGLFGTPTGSLSSGSIGGGTEINQMSPGRLDGDSSQSSPDAHRVSIRSAARILRSAMTSAVNSRNVPLMIDLYLSTAELKFLKGDKAGAISSWGQARNFFFRMLVVGTSIPIARRASLPHLRTIERQLNRMVRFLWACDKSFVNANVLLFDLHLNFSMDLDRAIRQNVLISHRMSFDLEPLLAKLDNQYEVAKLAEFEQTDRMKASAASPNTVPEPSDTNTNGDGSSANSVTGDGLSTHETYDSPASGDGNTILTETDGFSNYSGNSSAQTGADHTTESAGSAAAGDAAPPPDQTDCMLPKIIVPLHISMKGKTDAHVASLRTIKKPSRCSYGHARDGTDIQHRRDSSVAATDEALVRRAWGLYLCLASPVSIHQQKGQYSRVKELGLEEIFSAVSTCTLQMATDRNVTGIADVNFDTEQGALMEETVRKVSICAGGSDINTIRELPMLASDRGMRVCKVVFTVHLADLLLMYHPFSGRKHAQLFGCANFSSYSDANDFLEPRLRSLVVSASGNQHSHEITYNYPRRQHGGAAGFSLEQISLGSDFSKMIRDLAIASDGAKCSGGPSGRLMIVDRLKSGPLSAISRMLEWVADPRLYEHLLQGVAGAAGVGEHDLLGANEAAYGGVNSSNSRGGHGHGPVGGPTRGTAPAQAGLPHGLSDITGMFTRGIYSVMDPSASMHIGVEAASVVRAPITLLCSPGLQVLPWELLVSPRDVLVRGLNFLSGTRALVKELNAIGPTNGHRPAYVGCALGLSGVPIKLKNDIQKCETLSRELGVAYCVHRLFSSYVPKRSQWYEQSRHKPPFDLQNTRVPPEIVSKYVNVVNSYWRQDLPSYTPLLPVGKTNSQQLRSKPLQRVSFADLSRMLSADANLDPRELTELIHTVEDAPLAAGLRVVPSSERFQVIFFSYADVIEMASTISYVLNSKTEEMVCIFVPHFCVSKLAKEIVRVVDACYEDCVNGDSSGAGGGGEATNYYGRGIGMQQQSMPPQHPHLALAYGGYDPSGGFQPPGLAPPPQPWGQVSMNGGGNGDINMSFDLPGAHPQSEDGGVAQYQMPIPSNPEANRKYTSLAFHALVHTVKIAEKQQGVYIPIFA